MSTGAIIAVIVAVVVVIAIVAAVTMMRGDGTSGAGLKRRFGPEYERTLARHDGDDKATRQELAERVKRYGDMERPQVSAEQRERYGERWAEIQAHFVDDPGRALGEADRLTAEVAAERGFPGSDSPEHFDALSVHHPHQVQGHRQAHALAEHTGAGGQQGTEDMRQALVSSRALFDDMLREDAGTPSRETAPEPVEQPVAGTEPVPAAAAPADEPGTERDRADADADARAEADAEQEPDADPAVAEGDSHHRPLADRFAGLTGGSRRDRGTDDHS
jgi:hypothetical protein